MFCTVNCWWWDKNYTKYKRSFVSWRRQSFNKYCSSKTEFIESSKKFGSQCIVVAIDAKNISKNKWEVFTHGGRNKTGIDVVEFSKKVEKAGAGEILLTSMDRDGTKSGYDIELLKMVTKKQIFQ